MHKLENQREVILRAMDIVERFSGKRPRGWFGPGLTQTFDTADYPSEAGIEYIGDWACDDEPVTLKTKHKPIVALPYNFELHDIVMMALQHLGQRQCRVCHRGNLAARRRSGRRSARGRCRSDRFPRRSADPRVFRRVATRHRQCDHGAGAAVQFLLALPVRAGRGGAARAAPMLVAVAIQVFTGWKGGELVFRHRVAVYDESRAGRQA